jgi:hypothetical protein
MPRTYIPLKVIAILNTGNQCLHYTAHKIELVLINGVTQVWIQTVGHFTTQALHNLGSMVNPFLWNMNIRIAAS